MRRSTAAFCGGFITIGVYSLWQDYQGVERHVEWCRAHWQPAAETVPLALAIILAALVALLLAKEEQRT